MIIKVLIFSCVWLYCCFLLILLWFDTVHVMCIIEQLGIFSHIKTTNFVVNTYEAVGICIQNEQRKFLSTTNHLLKTPKPLHYHTSIIINLFNNFNCFLQFPIFIYFCKQFFYETHCQF